MLDLWIVSMFLLITLVVGIWQGRGVKTFKSFAIADREYSTGILVATIAATWIGGGSSLGVAEKSFIVGVFFYFVILGDMIDQLLQAKFIAPNIDKFHDCISVGDIIGKIYGKKAKIITGISGILSLVAILAAQIAAIGQIFHYFLGITPLTGIMIGGGIVTIYSFFGGVKAVTITDVIQFIVLIIAVPMICNVGLGMIGGYSNLIDALPANHLSLLPPKGEFWTYFNMFIVFSIPTMSPAFMQRLLMAQNGKQARNSILYSVMIYIPFYKMVCVIGLLAFIMHPDLNPLFAMPDLINSILPAGLKGIAICGILAIVMSTADSVINVWSVLIVHDVINPLYKREISDKTQLKLARFFTLIIGVWGCLIALKFKSLVDIILLSRFFWKPIIVVGLFSGIVGFKASKQSFYLGVLAGVITMILSLNFRLEQYLKFNGTILAIVANAVFFFGSHYYYQKLKTVNP